MTAADETQLLERLRHRIGQLQTERGEVEPRWRDATAYVLPRLGFYDGKKEVSDDRSDATATHASKINADGFYGQICSAHLNWFKYRVPDPEIGKQKSVRDYLENLRDYMRGVFERSTFYEVTPTAIQQGRVIGTSTVTAELDPATKRIICRVRHPLEVYLATDRFSRISEFWLKYKLSAEDAVAMFDRDRLSQAILEAERKTPYTEFEFIHAAVPRIKRNSRARNIINAPWAAYDFENAGQQIVRESGYASFPAPTWRPQRRAHETYGYCETDDTMPDILTVNNMMKTIMRSAHGVAEPPVFAPDDMKDLDMSPGARNWYSDWNKKVYTVEASGRQLPFTYQMMLDHREIIRRGYNVDYYLMLMHRTTGQMTAREVLERKEERNTVLGADVGAFEIDYLNSIHERFLHIERQAGRLPEPPAGKEKLLEQFGVKVEYQGPLSQVARETEVTSRIINLLDYGGAIMERWPETKAKIKPEILLDDIFDVFGVPEKAIRSNQEYHSLLQRAEEVLERQREQEMQAAAAGAGRNGRQPAQSPAAVNPAMQMEGVQ